MTAGADCTAVIMQPTFLPWLGYFALIAEADRFVFLDDVQFSKQSWQSRNRVAGPNGEVLLSLPVVRKPSKPLIRDARIAGAMAGELIPRVEGSLGKAPHWPLVRRLLEAGLARVGEGLAATNIALIRLTAEVLGLATVFACSSELELGTSDRGGRLRAICETLGASLYLSPVGSAGYLAEDNPFEGTSTDLRFQNFTHPDYQQSWTPFRSHMSVIDALAYLGPEATRAAILQGIGPHLTLQEIEEGLDVHEG